MSMYLKKELKIKPKSDIFKSDIELKNDIVSAKNTKELVITKGNSKDSKEITPYKEDVPEIKFWLDTPEHVRQSISRIIRLVGHGEYPIDRGGKICYLFQTLLQAWKTEDELQSYKEIIEIKQMLKELKNEGKI